MSGKAGRKSGNGRGTWGLGNLGDQPRPTGTLRLALVWRQQ